MPGFGSVGVWEVILILAILLLVFGAKRLPEIGAALGKGIREFKGSVREIENEFNRPDQPRADLPRSEAQRQPPEEPARPRSEEPARPRSEAPPQQAEEAGQPHEVESTRKDDR
jgi:sec-independent protein translocase protein TatA